MCGTAETPHPARSNPLVPLCCAKKNYFKVTAPICYACNKSRFDLSRDYASMYV